MRTFTTGKITKDEILHLGEEHKDENFHLGEFEQALPTFEYNSKEHRYMPSRHTRMDAILGL